jgi:hypothetical protein
MCSKAVVMSWRAVSDNQCLKYIDVETIKTKRATYLFCDIVVFALVLERQIEEVFAHDLDLGISFVWFVSIIKTSGH